MGIPRSFRRFAFSFLCAGASGLPGLGCASGEGGLVKGQSIDPSWSVYVAPIPDVTSTDNEVVPQSGTSLQAALVEALKKRGFVIAPFPGMQTYDLEAKFIRWEDRATEWNGLPDQLTASVTLRVGSYGPLVSSADINVKSSVIAFVHEEPDRLIPDLAKAIVDKIAPAK